MRVGLVGTLFFGLLHFSLFYPNYGLEAGKRSGNDEENYRPRKWSQVREGPYSMVVSSGTRNSSEKQNDKTSDKSEETDEDADKSDEGRSKETDKILESIGTVSTEAKQEKVTQRSKLARKRERVLSSETIYKPHHISVPQSYSLVSTPIPDTVPHKLYYRPLEQGTGRESIIPFLEFGKKLSTGRTPSGINSIEGSSTPSGSSVSGFTTEREDKDLYHEDMDISIFKRKAVERNNVPRGRLALRNSGITTFYRKNVFPRANTQESLGESRLIASPVTSGSTSSTLSLKKEVTSSESFTVDSISTSDSISESTPIIFPNSSVKINETDLLTNESKTTVHILRTLPLKNDTDNHSTKSSTVGLNFTTEPSLLAIEESVKNEKNETVTTQLPKPSPTAKILSTAVVTSVSVKETYRHPRIKFYNSTQIPARQKTTVIQKSEITKSGDESASSDFPKETLNKTRDKADVTTPVVPPVPVSHRARYQKSSYGNHSAVTPKVTTTTTTHKPVNRSLYSTRQREHKIKHISSQYKNGNENSRTSTENPITLRTDMRNSTQISNENKSKMYLTIRSRLTNQSSTFRSTYRRNSTRPVPPVLRVIATPSSYIEVPKLVTKAMSAVTTPVPEQGSTSERVVSNSRSKNPQPESVAVNDTSLLAEDTKEIGATTVEDYPEQESQSINENTYIDPSGGEKTQEYNSTLSQDENENVNNLTQHRPIINIEPLDESKQSTTTEKSIKSRRPGLPWVYVGHRNVSVTKVPESSGVVSSLGLAAYALAAVAVVPVLLGIFLLLRQLIIKSKKKMLDESEYSSEYNRTPLPSKLPRIPSRNNWDSEKPTVATTSAVASQGTKWEFPRDKLRLQTLLGEGNFGQVWKAEADDISGHEGLTRLVAVKTVKEEGSVRERQDLLRELGIMQDLGAHPNVVTLLGCCTEREPYLLIMEYVMYGKLLTFLREHRTKAHYFNFSDLSSALTSRDLTVFAYCVARGMEYIVSKGIIHRDLAARNILVDHNKLCKIADFGMSRNVRDTGEIYEQRPNRGALPIRWMAPEALHYSLFTHKSDVWSFGILVWEIITLGSTPYSTMGAREVMRRVREGYRLERPTHCSTELFRVVARCWAGDPSKRPTFTDLKHDVAALLSDPETNGACVDLDALTEEMSTHSC